MITAPSLSAALLKRAEGASVRSEMLIYNFSTGVYSYASALHASTAPLSTDTLTIGASLGGASVYSGGVGAFYTVRIGRRFVSTTEAKEDFVGEAVPPTMTGRRRTPMLTFPTSQMTIAEQGNFAGPAYLWAGAATREADSRLVTPLVNVVVRSPVQEGNTYAPSRYYRRADFDSRYRQCVRYLFHAHASPKTNKARVRIHVRCWNTLGNASIATCYFSMLSMDRLPADPGDPLVYRTATQTVASPQAAPGQWLDLGIVHIARTPEGLSYFSLAHSIGLDSGAAVEAQTAIVINAVTIEPLFIEDDGAGYDGPADLLGG